MAFPLPNLDGDVRGPRVFDSLSGTTSSGLLTAADIAGLAEASLTPADITEGPSLPL